MRLNQYGYVMEIRLIMMLNWYNTIFSENMLFHIYGGYIHAHCSKNIDYIRLKKKLFRLSLIHIHTRGKKSLSVHIQLVIISEIVITSMLKPCIINYVKVSWYHI